jgi:ABC-2 type transport system ATP-binding protein
VRQLIQLCRSLSPTWNAAFFDHLIKTFKLPLDRKVKALSAGMRAQLNLALAMAADPEVLILDDPTLGLDTVARRQFLELAIDLIQKQDKTILFSSHILADVERIADRVGILVNGSLVVDCALEALKQRVTQVRVIFNESPPPLIPLNDVIRCRVEGREVMLTAANWTEHKRAMIEALGPAECCEQQMSLEEIFLACSGSQPVVFNHEEGASHA